ncbi:MAG: hypothetical protein WC375_01165 [Methanomassiliicoccales archaeon]|jgi:hypothetical protein
MNNSSKSVATAYMLGWTYVTLGLLGLTEVLFGPDWLSFYPSGDIMTDLIVVLTGMIMLTGAMIWMKDPQSGEAYLMMGAALGLFIAVVGMLTMGANGLDLLVTQGDMAGWSPVDDLTPAIVLFLPSLIVLARMWASLFSRSSRKTAGGIE